MRKLLLVLCMVMFITYSYSQDGKQDSVNTEYISAYFSPNTNSNGAVIGYHVSIDCGKDVILKNELEAILKKELNFDNEIHTDIDISYIKMGVVNTFYSKNYELINTTMTASGQNKYSMCYFMVFKKRK